MVSRGRPPKKRYFRIDEYLIETERVKREFLNLRNYYLMRRVVAATLLHAGRKILKVREGQTVFTGTSFRCPRCGRMDRGEKFTVDFDHVPPRLRVPLKCGHRLELLLRCPLCGEKISSEKVWNERKARYDHDIFCVTCGWNFHLHEVKNSRFGREFGE